MPVYEVELSDGRIVELEADREPSESDVLAALGQQETPPEPQGWSSSTFPWLNSAEAGVPEFSFPQQSTEDYFNTESGRRLGAGLLSELSVLPTGSDIQGVLARSRSGTSPGLIAVRDPDEIWQEAFQKAIPTVDEMRALQPDIRRLSLFNPIGMALGALPAEISQPIIAGGLEALAGLTAPGSIPYLAAPGAAGRVLLPAFAATTVPPSVADIASGAGALSAGDTSGIQDIARGAATVGAIAAPVAAMRRTAPTPSATASRVSELSAMDGAAFAEAMRSLEGGYTADAHRTGLAAKTPDDVSALRRGMAEAESKAKEAQQAGDIEGAMSYANMRQYFREATEAATGTGSAGELLRQRDASYKPPVPETAEVLSDIYRIFEPTPKERALIGQKVAQVAEALRTGLSSKYRPVNKLAEDIAKSYGRENPKDIAAIMEQLKGSQGKGEAQIIRFDRDVSKLVEGAEKDFNAYIFLRRSLDRLNQDAKDIQAAIAGEYEGPLNRRSVGRYTIPELEGKLSALEAKVGPERLSQFQQAADGYQRYMDEALGLQVESGRMAPEVYDAIKEGNQFYAPFKVMKYIEETSKPEGSGSKIDTVADFTKAMTGIEDATTLKLGDMLGAARQSILLSRILADKNMAMRNVAELANTDVDGRFIQKLKAGEEAAPGWETVNVMQRGKVVKYATNPDVAQALEMYGQAANGVLSRTLSAFGVPFRAGATALNIPFQVSNILADTPRSALVSKYGIRQASDIVRYPMEYIESMFSSIAAEVGRSPEQTIANPMDFAASFVDASGAPTQPALGKRSLYMDYLDSGAAGASVQQYLTPEMLKFKEPTNVSKSRKLADSVLGTIPRFAQAIEQSNKILGIKRAMRFEGAQSGAELARRIPEAVTEVRRFSGSPDFGRQGQWVEAARLNLIYMFLNARIQGTVADVGRLAGRDGGKTAAQTWFRVGSAVGIPTAILYALNQRPEYKEDYEKRSKLEKDNYWLIPKDSFITTEDGEKMRDYWRIPKRESAKWMANMVESALNFGEKRDPGGVADFGAQMLQELVPVNIQGETIPQRMESVASGLNPLLKLPLEVATQRDLYRHRPLIPESMESASPELQYTKRTADAFIKLGSAMPDIAPEFMRSPIMLENMTRNISAGLITQFLPRDPVEGRSSFENQPLMQRFQALPYSDSTKFREEMQAHERDAADTYLNRHREVERLLHEKRGLPLAEIVKLTPQSKENPEYKDVKFVNHLVDLWTAEFNGITANERKVLSLPAKQRSRYILSRIQEATPEKRQALIETLARKRILTEAVIQELGEIELQELKSLTK